MITRTIKTTTVKGLKLGYVDGKVVQTDIEFTRTGNETMKDNAIMRKFEEMHGKGQYLITEKTETENTYGMEEEEFLKLAKIVNRPSSQQTKQADVKEEVKATAKGKK